MLSRTKIKKEVGQRLLPISKVWGRSIVILPPVPFLCESNLMDVFVWKSIIIGETPSVTLCSLSGQLWQFTKISAYMWQKAISKGHQIGLKINRVSLLVKLSNNYTTRCAPWVDNCRLSMWPAPRHFSKISCVAHMVHSITTIIREAALQCKLGQVMVPQSGNVCYILDSLMAKSESTLNIKV